MVTKCIEVFTNMDWKSNAISAFRDTIHHLLLCEMNEPNELGRMVEAEYPGTEAAFLTTTIEQASKIANDLVTAAIVRIGKKEFDLTNDDEVDVDKLKELLMYVLENNVHFNLKGVVDKNHIIVNQENTILQIISWADKFKMNKGEKK